VTKYPLPSTPEQRAKFAEKAREWRANNLERSRAIAKASRDRNRDKATARRRAHREANREQERATRLAYREINKEKIATYQQQWRANNPDYHRKHTHGLTVEDYNRLFEAQGGMCGICAEPLAKSINIDHDHIRGTVRGILCHHCNVGLVHFRDNPMLLSKALQYLERNTPT
jgi:hypothetical protein